MLGSHVVIMRFGRWLSGLMFIFWLAAQGALGCIERPESSPTPSLIVPTAGIRA